MAIPTGYATCYFGPATPGGTLQTDPAHSYATVMCDDSRTLLVGGHLFKSLFPSQQLLAYYSLDGAAAAAAPSPFTTSADGTGDFAFSVEGITSGNHTVTIQIYLAATNTPLFTSTSPPQSGGAPSSVAFTCP